MTYFRSEQILLRDRLAESTPLIQVLVGPRQVGKTTAIRQALNEQGIYETADSPAPLDASVINHWWQQATQIQEGPFRILAIDEIQKIPGWSQVIKKLWDNRKNSMKLVLSGSAALAIEKNLKESLAGRYELIRFGHWNYQEAKNQFGLSIKTFIEFGCYPGSIRFMNDLERWGDYIRDSILEPVLGRDIIQLHPIQNPSLFRQLVGFSASNPAQIISLQKLQGQLQDRGAIATLQHYLELLSYGFLVTGIQKFSTSVIRAKRSSPKLIVHDNALIRALERPLAADLSREKFGHYFENAVTARFIEAGWETYYWNERQNEVDLVTLGPRGEKLAIEIKSSETTASELKGLRVFCKRHESFEPCLISFLDQKVEGFKSLSTEKVLGLSRFNNFT